jgi:hypothetical protein
VKDLGLIDRSNKISRARGSKSLEIKKKKVASRQSLFRAVIKPETMKQSLGIELSFFILSFEKKT